MRTTRSLWLAVLCTHNFVAVATSVDADQVARHPPSDTLDKAFQRLDQAEAKTVASAARWTVFDGETYLGLL